MFKLWILVCAFVAVLADETTNSTSPPGLDEVELFQKIEILKLIRSLFKETRELNDIQRNKMADIIKNVSGTVDEYHSYVELYKSGEVYRVKYRIQKNCPGQTFNESSVNYCFDKFLHLEKVKFNGYKNCVYRNIMSYVNNLDELDEIINTHSEELEDAVEKLKNAKDNREMKNICRNVFNTFQTALVVIDTKLDGIRNDIGNFFNVKSTRDTISLLPTSVIDAYLHQSRQLEFSDNEEDKVNHYDEMCYTLNTYKPHKALPFSSYYDCIVDNNRCAETSTIANINNDLE